MLERPVTLPDSVEAAHTSTRRGDRDARRPAGRRAAGTVPAGSMARRLGTEVVVLPDAGHSPAVENPAALAAVLL